MPVCMYVCVYVCVYVCMYAKYAWSAHHCEVGFERRGLCMYVCMYGYVDSQIFLTDACMYVYVYVCVYVCKPNMPGVPITVK